MKRKAKEIKRIARDMLNNRYQIPMGAFVTASLITTVIEIPFSLSLGDYPSVPQLAIFFLAEYLIIIISQVLNAGVFHVHLNMTRQAGQTGTKISDVFYPFKNNVERFFGSAFLFSVLILSGCIPLICCGIYFYYSDISTESILVLAAGGLFSLLLCMLVMVNYYFTDLFLLDYPEIKVLKAFKESRLLMKGNKRRLFYILLGFLGWGFLIFCSFGIAALWVCPYMTQTMTVFYLDCTEELNRIPVRDNAKEAARSGS